MSKAIILSGTFINTDLQTDFGKILPVELPLGNKMVIEHQIDIFNDIVSDITLTIPVSYATKFSDINTIQTPINYTIHDVFKMIAKEFQYEKDIYIIYGDTLINPRELNKLDTFLVSETKFKYSSWFYVDNESVFIGAFRTSGEKLTKLIDNTSNLDEFLRLINITLESIKTSFWHDVGSYTTYHNTRRSFLESRSFNSTQISNGIVIKQSDDIQKLYCEYKWLDDFSNIIPELVPSVFSFNIFLNKAEYKMEYFQLPTLAELYVYGNIIEQDWKKIILLTKDTLAKIQKISAPVKGHKFYSNKLLERSVDLKDFTELKSGNTGYYEKHIENAEKLDKLDDLLVSSHGDYCFSNILYDSRQNYIKLIDPRGMMKREDGYSNKMPSQYDKFKLAHSFVSGYDFIISNVNFKHNTDLFSWYCEIMEIDNNTLLMGLSHLFYTMIPLHKDVPKRQEKFYNLSKKYYDSINFSGQW